MNSQNKNEACNVQSKVVFVNVPLLKLF